jgi:hypothetical protein
MGKNVNIFVSESFTNEYGQTIYPGEKVAYVTNSSHNVNMRKAFFDGVFKNARGEIVFTRLRGVRTSKYIKTGKMITYDYAWFDKEKEMMVPATSQYPEEKLVDCTPEGTVVLQCHRIIKLEG